MARVGRGRRIIAGMAGAQAAAADLARARQNEEDDEELDPAQIEAAGRVFAAAEKYFKACRTYQEGYPALERFFSEMVEYLQGYLTQYEELEAALTPIEVGVLGTPVFEAERVEHNMWFPLYRDGIRQVTINDGVSTEELRLFFRSLVRLAGYSVDDDEGDGEDDAVTMLWDLSLENIGYVAIDTFAEGTDGEEASRTRLERVREMVTVSMMKDLARVTQADMGREAEIARRMKSIALGKADLAFLESENLATLDELPVRTKEARGDLYSLERWEVVLLHDELGKDPQLVEKFLNAVVRALITEGDAHEATALCERIEQFFDAIVTEGRLERATALRSHVSDVLAGPEAAHIGFEMIEAVDRAMSSEKSIRAIANQMAAAETEEDMAAVLGLVEVLPPSAATHLVMFIGVIGERRRRRWICDVMAGWGQRALEAADEALPKAEEEHALDILYLLRRIGSESAIGVLEQASRHRMPRVRAEATRFYVDAVPSNLAERRAKTAMYDPDSLVRRVGLDYMIHHASPSALRWVKEAIDSEKFATLEFGEKKRLYLAWAHVAGEQIGNQLLETLGQRNLLGKAEVDHERAGAAAALGHLRFADAKPVLEKLSKSRMTRGIVREACLEALNVIDQPPPPPPKSESDDDGARPAPAPLRARQDAPGSARSAAQPAGMVLPEPGSTRAPAMPLPEPAAPRPASPMTPTAQQPAATEHAGFHINAKRSVERVFSESERSRAAAISERSAAAVAAADQAPPPAPEPSDRRGVHPALRGQHDDRQVRRSVVRRSKPRGSDDG